MPKKNKFASTVAEIRTIIADEKKYPYLEDLVDPIGMALQSAPEAIPGLVTDFLRDLNAVYRKEHNLSRFRSVHVGTLANGRRIGVRFPVSLRCRGFR